MSKIAVYATGGCPINILRDIDFVNEEHPNSGFAPVRVSYIDTSKSNLDGVSNGDIFLIDHDAENKAIDGSGKIRRANYESIKKSVAEVLFKHKPQDLNIVVHAGSGGSGSVTGPSLVKELLAMEQTVIVILIGSQTCTREAQNTVDTLMTYQQIAVNANRSIPAFYVENDAKNLLQSFSDNNERVKAHILLCSVLWSGDNHGLDSADLRNFLNYNLVNKNFQPGLTELQIFSLSSPLMLTEKGQAVSSVVTLVQEGQDPSPTVITPYHSYGVLRCDVGPNFKKQTPLHIATIQGAFPPIVRRLQEQIKAMDEQFSGAGIQSVVVKDADEDGFVL